MQGSTNSYAISCPLPPLTGLLVTITAYLVSPTLHPWGSDFQQMHKTTFFKDESVLFSDYLFLSTWSALFWRMLNI